MFQSCRVGCCRCRHLISHLRPRNADFCKGKKKKNIVCFSLLYAGTHQTVSVLPRQHRECIFASSLGNAPRSRCELPIKAILNPARIFQTCEIAKYLIGRAWFIRHCSFPACQSLFGPFFLGEQLFAQTAASAIRRSREAIKKSSQCCVSVDPFLFLHVIPSLMPPPHTHTHQFSLRHAHTHTHTDTQTHTHTLMPSPIRRVMVGWYGDSLFFFFFSSKDKSPKLQWHGTVGFEALLRLELRGAM